ncbi:MAG: DUF2231 domain-containing protein [Pseudomonadota bacterium]
MVLRAIFMALIVGFFLVTVPQPASAHRDHDPPDTAETVVSETAANENPDAMAGPSHQEEAGASPDAGFLPRLIDWLGRTHPMLVHFPIALFPAGLLAMLIARQRPAWTMTARFLIIAGGIAAIPAAALGWFGGGFDIANDETLITVHRWLGTVIALGGGILAFLAWRVDDFVRRPTALSLIVAIVIALVVQGWFGGALVHGADHLAW